MSLPRGSDLDGRWRGSGKPGVARLADLDRPVVDKLRCDQESGGGKDGEADRPLWSEHAAGAGRGAPRPGCSTQQPTFEQGKAAQEEYADGPQVLTQAGTDRLRPSPQASEQRPGPLQQAVGFPVELASRGEESWGRRAQALFRPARHRP
jgi:hypothetical protein